MINALQETRSECYVVYGGQYGSEGKASAAEFFAKRVSNKRRTIAVGENSPNSGHTSSRGSTRNIPACSFWTSAILLGPDSVIDPEVIVEDWKKVLIPIYIHENAALLNPKEKGDEAEIVKRISSTGSGSGIARKHKYIERQEHAIIKGTTFREADINILSAEEYDNQVLTYQIREFNMIFECSQGVLLDTNLGIYPYVTSRCTLPRVAVERNGLGSFPWTYAGVYRTYPIRTGGPSGPTHGAELAWKSLGLPPEIATVTKRQRRVFEFSEKDFRRSVALSRPDILMFSHLDYLDSTFDQWASFHNISNFLNEYPCYGSMETGVFNAC